MCIIADITHNFENPLAWLVSRFHLTLQKDTMTLKKANRRHFSAKQRAFCSALGIGRLATIICNSQPRNLCSIFSEIALIIVWFRVNIPLLPKGRISIFQEEKHGYKKPNYRSKKR